ncbi:MAG: ATP-binding protein [Gemmataceae bacterium]
MASRNDVDVLVDGHADHHRHLAILAMTGAGKSWTSRRIIEQLAEKNYPIVIFDPHGDYTGLSDVIGMGARVRRYYAHFPIFDEDSETVASIVSSLAYELSSTMRTRFGEVFAAARRFLSEDAAENRERTEWLIERIGKPDLRQFGLERNLWLVSYLAEAGDVLVRERDRENLDQLADWCWPELRSYTPTDARTLEGIKKRSARAAWTLSRMEQTNRRIAGEAKPLPTDRRELVQHGQVSIVSLAGYTSDFQATIYTVIADDLFNARVRNDLAMPVLLVLEEAHTFSPGRAMTPAEQRSVLTTRQIAQEGRKFNVGLVLISQRPSRLDETTLSQCNSYVIMRLVNPADQSFVCKVIETMGENEARMLPDLDVGEALLAGQMINFPVLARVKPPLSKGEREEEDAFALLERMRHQKPGPKSAINGQPARKPR